MFVNSKEKPVNCYMRTVQEHADYWRKLANSDLEVARRMLKSGKDLHYCLFFGHMSVEKLLKGLVVVKTHKTPPPIHDTVRLAKKASIFLDEEKLMRFDKFNSFNLDARYPDYKLSFYKKCTPEFAKENFSQIEEAFEWLEKQFPKLS